VTETTPFDPGPVGTVRASRAWRPLLLALLLLAATFLAYQPAWHGGMLWDDDGHITKPELRSAAGLRHIWFDVGATQQYYPLLHTLFWLEHRLWGNAMTGYHAVTILLHALAALLVAAILRRLNVPGAWLAAAIFALHPVHVESVAWVTEQKNTLSGALYLGAMLAYLRFDGDRRTRHYTLALALFVLALLSKTVAATLPAALLVILWWKRGRLDRRDVLPLLPWFLLGAGSGLVTAWVERNLVGAAGADFDFTLLQRSVIAGRDVVFYLGKLLWPAGLTFNYPRWEIPRSPGWQLFYPLGVTGALAGLWSVRRRSRAPLAAALFFGVTLFPSLGFFAVFPFFYSFVADHFQYLASLGPITLFSASLAGLLVGRPARARVPVRAAAIAVVALLGTLSWRQSRQYIDEETLYRETLARNPGSFLALNNLCCQLRDRGQLAAALPLCEEAVRLNPGWDLANENLGVILSGLGRLEEALPYLLAATRLNRDDFLGYSNLSLTLLKLGRIAEAVEYGREAVRLKPGDAITRNTLCRALERLGRLAEAEEQCVQAVTLSPGEVAFHSALGILQQRLGKFQEAEASLNEAIRLDPGHSESHANLGLALESQSRIAEALAQYREAVRLDSGNQLALTRLWSVSQGQGRVSPKR